MKNRTEKRKQRDEEAREWRERQIYLVGACEWCGSRCGLCVHEIARGCDRARAQDKGYATLVLCHPKCHDLVGGWPRGKQLALLYLRRTGEYDLAAYHALIARRYPDQEEIDGYIQELLLQKEPRR